MTKALFVSVGNAGRSQMAQAFFPRGRGPVRSAGTWPSPELHGNVIEAMREIGIDLSRARPRKVTLEDAEWADVVIRMSCGGDCPVATGTSYRDWPVADPIGLSVEETRPIRDEIARRVAALVAELRVESLG